MKNLFLTLALLLTVSFAFANSNENIRNHSKTDLETVDSDYLATSSNSNFSSNQNKITYLEQLILKDCTLKGKFTITFSDGSKYSWEGTLTIVGQSCAEFLKEMMQ